MTNLEQFNFNNSTALVRVDFNVPFNENMQITDDTRIVSSLTTIKKIIQDGGKVVLMSHLGRPKGEKNTKYSLKPVAQYIKQNLNLPIHFADDCIGEEVKNQILKIAFGEIILLENLRFYAEEEKGDEQFAKQLSELGDVYVNDAFGTAHRAHASTAIIASYFSKDKKMFGYLMNSEVTNAQKVLNNAQRPMTAILGGAKVSDKLLILENLINIADNIIVGGGMAYTFFKAMGGQIGNSLCENERLDTANEIIKKTQEKGVKFLIPIDSKTADKFSNDANIKVEKSDCISAGYMGLDIGPEACNTYSETILNSKTILWNGPMGVFEMENFQNGTKKIAESVAEATKNGAFSLVGGGDSVAAVNKFGFQKSVSFVSTGGGALLEFFEGKILPGIAAILND